MRGYGDMGSLQRALLPLYSSTSSCEKFASTGCFGQVNETAQWRTMVPLINKSSEKRLKGTVVKDTLRAHLFVCNVHKGVQQDPLRGVVIDLCVVVLNF